MGSFEMVYKSQCQNPSCSYSGENEYYSRCPVKGKNDHSFDRMGIKYDNREFVVPSARNTSNRSVCDFNEQEAAKASNNSIARWIVNTVKYAYEHADTDTLQFVRAHDTRKLSTSWALFNGLSSQEILRAAHWSNETTFTSYYLKDVRDLESRFAKAAILHTANRRQKKY
ncbi:Hypothetical predicted protein [Mytilus galloprovincialis]|uniref:Tyr recombinase domain-containing protein n=1 Tax=Mytilus galloprovincialis TaxID=29158 RepID=A0A8B6DZQ9_MYTGA|nr:Hypothetical predicted protein [Mytilus galloprovincialis]